jgi:hypothetical protein
MHKGRTKISGSACGMKKIEVEVEVENKVEKP